MIIYGEKMVNDDDYRVLMFKKNRLKRFAEFKINYINNSPVYYYEISSKQSLQHLFYSRKLLYDDIVKIVYGIQEAVDELGKYLLDTEYMILEPEKIFLDSETLEPEFCYCPGNENGLLDGIRGLFRFFLNIIDNSDKKTVEFAYEIYCKSMRENFKFDSIFESIGKCSIDVMEEAAEEQDFPQEDRESTEGKKGIVQRIKDFLTRMFKEDRAYEEIEEENSRENTEMEAEENSGTVLLEDVWECHRLVAKDGESVIELAEFPCLIGKLAGKVNEVVHSEMVSRIHAEVVQEENQIYIMDMNSKNGTYVNGIRLSPYEKKILRPQDKVRFADMEYIYE